MASCRQMGHVWYRVSVYLFLLPGGRPRFFGAFFESAIQAGGRPRRLPRPLASRSSAIIASLSCSRSWRRSESIFNISISGITSNYTIGQPTSPVIRKNSICCHAASFSQAPRSARFRPYATANAINLLSGAQKGLRASSVPGRGRAGRGLRRDRVCHPQKAAYE